MVKNLAYILNPGVIILISFLYKLEFEFKTLSFAYEYISRKNDLADTHRSSGLIKYKISEKVVLTGAFGRNFGKGKNLISLIGINWSLAMNKESVSSTP